MFQGLGTPALSSVSLFQKVCAQFSLLWRTTTDSLTTLLLGVTREVWISEQLLMIGDWQLVSEWVEEKVASNASASDA